MDEIRPQPGAQEQFLASPADIAIYGGAAGGGKTWALLLEPLRHIHVPGFAAVLFRRTYPEVTAPGGMWPESQKLYPQLGASPNESAHQWKFPGGVVVKFGHMQHEKDKNNWLGAQIALIGFDQLERFTEDQFFFMMSRNRSVCGVRPYVRATANPEPGWLSEFLSWWIDQGSGYPIPDRAGRLRWFIRVNGKIEWADSREQLAGRQGDVSPKSVTFVPAKLQDNRILMAADPGYMANLMALPHVEQLRLLGGNWKISSAQGEWPPSYFDGPGFWFEDWPADGQLVVKTMALDPSKGADAKLGDFQALVSYGRDRHGTEYIDADMGKRPMTAAEAPDGTRFTDGMVEVAVDEAIKFKPHGFGLETNQFQLLLKNPILAEARRRSYDMPLYEINNKDHKLLRIRRLGPPLSQRKMRFRATPGGRLLVSQLRTFPDPNYNDDGPDGLEMARRLAIELFNSKAN